MVSGYVFFFLPFESGYSNSLLLYDQGSKSQRFFDFAFILLGEALRGAVAIVAVTMGFAMNF